MENQKIFIYPEFAKSPVPIKVAAKVIGVSEKTIREKMEAGIFDIGITYRKEHARGRVGSRNCYISPKKFWELTGYIWSEEEMKKYSEK